MSLSHLLERQIDLYADKEVREEEERKIRAAENSMTGEKNRYIRAVRARLAVGQDARTLVVGEGGVGKSDLVLVAGKILNPELYENDVETAADKAISFSALQFMDSTLLPSHSVLDFDEPGQGWYHRQFMSEANQILAQTFIGNRFQKFVTFLTVPTLNLIDVDALRMSHFYIYIGRQGYAEVYRILNQKFGGEPRYKKLIDSMPFPKLEGPLWDRYMARKVAFQTQLYAEFRRRLLAGQAPKLTNYEIADAILVKPELYMRDDDPERIDYAKIQDLFGVGVNRAYSIKSTVTRKLAEKRQQAALSP